MADETPPISDAYFHAVEAISQRGAQLPLPKGLNIARVGDWTLTLNASSDTLTTADGTEIPAWNLLACHEVYFALGIFGPFGGMIGGASEDQFIADMKAPAA